MNIIKVSKKDLENINYLKIDVINLEKEIAEKEDELSELKTRVLYSSPSQGIDEKTIVDEKAIYFGSAKTGVSTDKIPNFIIMINTKISKLKLEIDELKIEKWNLEEEVNNLLEYIDKIEDVTTRNIIKFRYLKGMTWENIGYKVHLSKTSVLRKHKKFFNNTTNIKKT